MKYLLLTLAVIVVPVYVFVGWLVKRVSIPKTEGQDSEPKDKELQIIEHLEQHPDKWHTVGRDKICLTNKHVRIDVWPSYIRLEANNEAINFQKKYKKRAKKAANIVLKRDKAVENSNQEEEQQKTLAKAVEELN